MQHPYPPSAAPVAGNPIYAMFVPFPVVCFTLTLLTDIAFWRTSHLMWNNFSAWLLLAGLVGGSLAALARAVDLSFRPKVRAQRHAWLRATGGLIVLGLAFVNSLVHAGDGWTAIVPYGLVLSAATVLAICVTAWLGRAANYHSANGVPAYE